MHVKVAMLKFIVNSQNLIVYRGQKKSYKGQKMLSVYFECKFECKVELRYALTIAIIYRW